MPDITITIPPAYTAEVIEAFEAEHGRPDGMTDLQFGQWVYREKTKQSVRSLRAGKRALANRQARESDETEVDGAL